MSNSIDQSNPIQVTTYYYSDGMSSNQFEPSKEHKIVAKKVQNISDNKTAYYAKTHGKRFYRPNEACARYDRAPWKLTVINQNKFDNYLTYLGFFDIKFKNREHYLTIAERD